MISRAVRSSVRSAVTFNPASLQEIADSAEATALVARFSTPPTTQRKGQINALIAALKQSGVWSKLEVFYVLAAADSQAALLNWKANASNLTATSSPTFAADRGYTGNGTSSYLSISGGWTPSLMTQNDAHVSVYTRTAASYDGVTNRIDVYAGATRLGRRVSTDTTGYSWRLNDATGINTSVAAQTGLFTAARIAAATKRLYRNDGLVASSSSTSTANATVFELLRGVTTIFSDAQISAASAGTNLTDDNVRDYHTALNAYLSAVGAV